MTRVAALSLGSAQAANAVLFRYDVISKTSAPNVTGAVFSKCHISTNGGTCAITRGKTMERSIQVSLGANRADVSAGLGIGSSRSVTTTVQCNSPALKAGHVWKGRALGTRYTYKVQKQQAYKPRVGPTRWKTVGTSSILVSYNPKASDISCGL